MTDEPVELKPISRQLKSYRKLRDTPKAIAARKRKWARTKRKMKLDPAFRESWLAKERAALTKWRRSKGIKPRKKAE